MLTCKQCCRSVALTSCEMTAPVFISECRQWNVSVRHTRFVSQTQLSMQTWLYVLVIKTWKYVSHFLWLHCFVKCIWSCSADKTWRDLFGPLIKNSAKKDIHVHIFTTELMSRSCSRLCQRVQSNLSHFTWWQLQIKQSYDINQMVSFLVLHVHDQVCHLHIKHKICLVIECCTLSRCACVCVMRWYADP